MAAFDSANFMEFHNGEEPYINEDNLLLLQKTMMLCAYPVGSYYWSSESTDPSRLFGGTWERVKDKFVYALGDSGSAGDTGGASTHKHLLPMIVDNLINWSKFQWNTGFNYGSEDASSANTNTINNTPSAEAFSGKQPYTQPVSNMPPYIKAYCWRRTA